jgi:hypothetical protein
MLSNAFFGIKFVRHVLELRLQEVFKNLLYCIRTFLLAIIFTIHRTSVADPWHFGTNQDPRL